MKKIKGFISLFSIAMAMSLGCAANVAAVEGNVTEIIDNVVLSVLPTCTFSTVGVAKASNLTFSGTSINGREVEFNDGGVHYFNIACNRAAGYSVYAYATPLLNGSQSIAFRNFADYETSGGVGNWTAKVTDGANEPAPFGTSEATRKVIKSTSSVSNADGDEFSVTYKAYVGSTTPAGTYTGQAVYLLTMNIDEGAPTPVAYTLHYEGGEGAENVPNSNSGTGSVAKVANGEPTRLGYDFLGWSDKQTDRIGIWQPGDLLTVTEGHSSPTLYAVWKKAYMQDFTAAKCGVMEVGDTKTLVDKRDEKVYVVKKMADNKCWMVQNLALEGGTVVEPTLSNVAASWQLPESKTTGFNSYTEARMENGSHTDGNTSSYGAYYNFVAATAGTGASVTGYKENLTYDICPKGWSLPTLDEQVSLVQAYGYKFEDQGDYWDNGEEGYDDTAFAAAWLPAFAGYRNYGSLGYAGSYGYWWSRTSYNADGAYDLYEDTDGDLLESADYRYYGFSVRCVSR